MSELPKGWANATFGDVTASVSNGIGGTQSKDGLGIPVSRIETIADQTINFDRVGYVAEYDPKKIERYRLNKGDILFSHINSPVHLGKTAMFDGDAALYHGINLLRIVVEQEVLLPQIFNYYCKLTRFQGVFAMRAQHAVNQSSINQKTLATFEIPVAPLLEQKRIADKLDSTLARVEACRDRLDRLPALLKRFRQSILTAATSGRLTEDWRTTRSQDEAQRNPGTAAPDSGADAPVFGLLGWHITSLGKVATDFSYGSAAKSSKAGRVPVLRMGNIQDGDLDWDDLVFTSDQHEIDKYRLAHGDVLFNRTNSPELVGKTAVFKGAREAIYAGYLIRVRCSHQLLPDYLNYCLGSPAGRDYCWQVKSDGVSQSNINAKKLAAFEFMLPPLAEQQEIVRRVEILFAFADRLESRLATARKQAEQLTPALLAKAFRGELVPQDPNDEPASELLKRLATTRTEAPKAKRGRVRASIAANMGEPTC